MKNIKTSEKENLFVNVCVRTAKFTYEALKEIVLGIYHDNFPVWRYCSVGLLMSYYFLFDWDIKVARIFGSNLYFEPNGKKALLVIALATSGLIIYGTERAITKTKLLERLKRAFDYCDLKSGGLYPSFIKDEPIDENVRQMRLFVPGIPLKKFLEKKEDLEAHFNANIVKIFEEENDKTRINIIYSMSDLPKQIVLENPDTLEPGEIPIGRTYDGDIRINLKDMGHMLVAGQTGGGKSNFLKLLTTTLSQNDANSEIHFLDFKEGIELAALVNKFGNRQKNFFPHEGASKSIEYLGGLEQVLEARLKEIKNSGAVDFEEYLKNKSNTPVKTENEDVIHASDNTDRLKRMYIVIDEIAQIYVKDHSVSNDLKQKARSAVNKLARQGRAAGVHLIVTTQKPDAQSFDQTVKANMPAILCFPMVNQVASIAALGTKRAFELNPDVKGRAIYKFGPKMHEVQTYMFQ